jgi:hypothetical protein
MRNRKNRIRYLPLKANCWSHATWGEVAHKPTLKGNKNVNYPQKEREHKLHVQCGSFEEVFEVFHWFTGVG